MDYDRGVSGPFAEGAAIFMAAELNKRAREKEAKKPSRKSDSRTLIREMDQLISAINAAEVLDHTDAGDLSDWLGTIRQRLRDSIQKLETLK